MSQPSRPAWPDSASFPFNLFGGGDLQAPAASPLAASIGSSLSQGLAGGVDLMKTMLGQMPGGSAIPGFLLPTVDVEELDKRISDLRAAESWLEVNLNMLRATIQGLEVQRNTIAAIHSLGAMGQVAMPTPKAAAPAPSTEPPSPATMGGLPPGWPTPSGAPTAASTPVSSEPVETTDPAEPEAPSDDAAPPTQTRPKRSKKADVTAAPANPGGPATALAGVAASQWMRYMQDQFAKVAQAALTSGARDAAAPVPAATKPEATKAKRVAKKKGTGRGTSRGKSAA